MGRRKAKSSSSALRTRDVLVLSLFCFALLRCLFFNRNNSVGSLNGMSFVKQWEILTVDSSSSSSPPKPLLPVLFFDLNGDGRQETLIAFDESNKIGIYDGSSRGGKGQKTKNNENGMNEDEDVGNENTLRLLKMVDLRETNEKSKTHRMRDEHGGKRVIALAAGRPEARRRGETKRRRSGSGIGSKQRRKTVVMIKRKAIFVAVTEELQVMTFDHNAKKKWERSARDALFSGKAHHRHHLGGRGGRGDSMRVEEIAVTVVSAKGENEDGLVVVGGRVEYEKYQNEEGEEGEDYERGMEAYARELKDDEMLSMHRGGRRDETIEFKEEGVEDIIEDDNDTFASQNGAFVYLAFNARSGELVWRRVASDFVADPAELLRTTTPAHEVRLDSHLTKIEEHKSKTDGICRSYRESALAEALPHAWRDAEDTRMRSAPFSKSQKQTSSSFGGRKKRARGGRDPGPLATSAATTNLKAASRDPNFAVADKTNDFSSLLSRGFSYLNLGKSAVHHRDDEREKLDYHNRRFHHQHMMSSSNNNIKNAIIAHHRDGVEVLDAFTGELICQLALQHPGYHADINGDGAIDHLDARGHRAHIADVAMDNFSPGCWASVTSGAPDVQTVFEGSICKPTRKSSMKSTPRQRAKSNKKQQNSGDFYLRNKNKDDVDVLTPIIVRRDDKSERDRSFRRATKDAVFLNSRGELTCYAKDGTRRWMVNTRASWKIDVNGPPKDGIYDLFSDVNNNNDSKEMDRFVPTLATFKFRTHHRHHGVSHNVVVSSSDEDSTNRTNYDVSGGGGGGSPTAPSPFLSQRSLFFNEQSRRRHTSEASLVVGSKRAVIVSPSGTKIATIFLPSMPIARAQVLDCNDDGKNDFIVRMETSTICYAQKSTSALSVYVVMLTSLVLSSFVAFIHRVEFESLPPKPGKKDDDFNDFNDDDSDSESSRSSSSNSDDESHDGEEKETEQEKEKRTRRRKEAPRVFPTMRIKRFARSTDVDIKAD